MRSEDVVGDPVSTALEERAWRSVPQSRVPVGTWWMEVYNHESRVTNGLCPDTAAKGGVLRGKSSYLLASSRR